VGHDVLTRQKLRTVRLLLAGVTGRAARGTIPGGCGLPAGGRCGGRIRLSRRAKVPIRNGTRSPGQNVPATKIGTGSGKAVTSPAADRGAFTLVRPGLIVAKMGTPRRAA
jgi:hypothetical protein